MQVLHTTCSTRYLNFTRFWYKNHPSGAVKNALVMLVAQKVPDLLVSGGVHH